MNGPEPTASLSLAKVAGFSTLDQTCSGMIGSWVPGLGACGAFSVMTRVSSSLASTAATGDSSEPLACCSWSFVWMALNVQAPSLAVIGWPSDHLRSLGRWNVQTLPSVEVSHFSAMLGMSSLFFGP